MIVKCPNCKTTVEWIAENSFKPFCSERCKLIDLGEWFCEEKRITDEKIDIDDEFLLNDHKQLTSFSQKCF